MEVKIDLNTDILTLRLRAIAKHSAALANDLEKIGDATYKGCGGLMDITELRANNEVVDTSFDCPQCNEEE